MARIGLRRRRARLALLHSPYGRAMTRRGKAKAVARAGAIARAKWGMRRMRPRQMEDVDELLRGLRY